MKEKINKRYDQLSELENFKQLSEDLETGKKFIRDYKDISIENNSFGMPSIKYNKNITGQQSYDSRLNKGYIKELKYGPLQYLPNTSHFIGSSMYPRPISIPFTNQMKKSTNLIILSSILYLCVYNHYKDFFIVCKLWLFMETSKN